MAGVKTETFGPGALSTTPANEWSFAFTPDEKTIYIQKGGMEQYGIYVSSLREGQWSEPVLSSFSPDALAQDGDPFITPDGQSFFFATNRAPGGGVQNNNDLWVAKKTAAGWGPARPLGPEINSVHQEWLPSVAANGNLYFESDRPGGIGATSLYVSQCVDGRYQTPRLLEVFAKGGEESPYIAPDESFLIFSRAGDLWISYRQNDRWTPEEKIPLEDKGSLKYSPWVSADRKFLFYTSNATGNADIYRVPIGPLKLKI